MKISNVAKLTGVTVRTLHYYDEIGLLKPSEVTEAGYRVYNHKDLEVLQQILFSGSLTFHWRISEKSCRILPMRKKVLCESRKNSFCKNAAGSTA